MRKKIFVSIVAISLLVGILSGCTEEDTDTEPEASFTYTANNQFIGTPISFTDQSTGEGTLTYLWDFGNGDTSTEQNPTYTYNAVGNYTVTLTVTDDGDQTDEYSMVVKITLRDIVTTAIDEGFSKLAEALTVADLVTTLQGDGPFTVFAPTNESFAALNQSWLTNLLNDTTNLTNVLLYHVLDGKVMSSVLTNTTVETLEGTNITVVVDTNVTINGATVTSKDIECVNGVIHVIDQVLLPESVPGPEE
jgi:uncharacterized surface protein with fasciclin (FAS1) repeats